MQFFSKREAQVSACSACEHLTGWQRRFQSCMLLMSTPHGSHFKDACFIFRSVASRLPKALRGRLAPGMLIITTPHVAFSKKTRPPRPRHVGESQELKILRACGVVTRKLLRDFGALLVQLHFASGDVFFLRFPAALHGLCFPLRLAMPLCKRSLCLACHVDVAGQLLDTCRGSLSHLVDGDGPPERLHGMVHVFRARALL